MPRAGGGGGVQTEKYTPLNLKKFCAREVTPLQFLLDSGKRPGSEKLWKEIKVKKMGVGEDYKHPWALLDKINTPP